MPNDEVINSFVKYYFKRYQRLDKNLDTEDKRELYKIREFTSYFMLCKTGLALSKSKLLILFISFSSF